MAKLPFASDVLLFAPPLLVAAILAFFFGWTKTGYVIVALLVFVLYFFRDPERIPPPGDDLIVSPADGKVVYIDRAFQSPDHPEGSICISIFLSVFNVHVQRSPLEGTVIRKAYNKGKFLAAWDHKASLDNEQSLTVFDTAIGPVGVKQIAGLIARRILTWVNQGDKVDKGGRIGLIRFGSRVDLIMPPNVEVVSKIGDVVTGGETVMAKISPKTAE